MLFTVVDLSVSYMKPARLDDELQVLARVDATGGASLEFGQEVRNADGAVLAQARVRVACVDRVSLRPRRLPADLAARIAA